MTPQDVLCAVTEAEIGREIIRLVPHWYEADCGPEKYSVPVGEHVSISATIASSRPTWRLSGQDLRPHPGTADGVLRQLPSLIDVLLESFAIDWLRMHSAATDWARLIKYLETVARRTYENQPVSLNLIVRAGNGRGRHLARPACRNSSISWPPRLSPTWPWTATCG